MNVTVRDRQQRMPDSKPHNRSLTNDDRDAARRLRALWDARKHDLGLTQETAAFALGFNQSSVSHYLSGRIALGVEATLKWARLLGVDPHEIRPDIPVAAGSTDPCADVAIPPLAGLQAPGLRMPARMMVDHGGQRDSFAHGLAPNSCCDVREGDLILINVAERAVSDGSVYVVELNGEATVRQMFKRSGDAFLLRADGIPDDTASAASVKVHGRVVWRSGWR